MSCWECLAKAEKYVTTRFLHVRVVLSFAIMRGYCGVTFVSLLYGLAECSEWYKYQVLVALTLLAFVAITESFFYHIFIECLLLNKTKTKFLPSEAYILLGGER